MLAMGKTLIDRYEIRRTVKNSSPSTFEWLMMMELEKFHIQLGWWKCSVIYGYEFVFHLRLFHARKLILVWIWKTKLNIFPPLSWLTAICREKMTAEVDLLYLTDKSALKYLAVGKRKKNLDNIDANLILKVSTMNRKLDAWNFRKLLNLSWL